MVPMKTQSTTNTKIVEIVGPNLIDQSRGTFEVHDPTCNARYRNVPKYSTDAERGWTTEITERVEVAEEVYADQAGDCGYEPGTPEYDDYMQDALRDFHFCSCMGRKSNTSTTNTGGNTMSKNNSTKICQCLTIVTEDEQTIVARSCGGDTGKTFAPGHDARTKGTLQKAFRTGRQILVNGEYHSAEDLAKGYGYERFLTPAPVRKSRKSRKTDEPIKVKLGRWTYDAVSLDELDEGGFEVVYVNKGGDTQRKVVKSDPRV